MLDVENLHAGYRRVRVLHDVTLSVATGETIGVLGQTVQARQHYCVPLRVFAACMVVASCLQANRSTENPTTSAPRLG